MRHVPGWVLGLCLIASNVVHAQSEPPLLLRFPTVSRTQIVFNYAGDLWIVGREGGQARRLTSGTGIETYPAFSPDGTMVAFTGEYDGNRGCFRGSGRWRGAAASDLSSWRRRTSWVGRLTASRCSSRRGAAAFMHFENQLYTVPLAGGLPTAAASDRGGGGLLARRNSHWPTSRTINGRRPGSATAAARPPPSGSPTWPTRRSTKVPRDNSNDHHPMWVGRHDLLPLRPQRPGQPVRLRHEDQSGVGGPRTTTGSTSSPPRPGPTPSSSSSSAPSSCST